MKTTLLLAIIALTISLCYSDKNAKNDVRIKNRDNKAIRMKNQLRKDRKKKKQRNRRMRKKEKKGNKRNRMKNRKTKKTKDEDNKPKCNVNNKINRIAAQTKAIKNLERIVGFAGLKFKKVENASTETAKQFADVAEAIGKFTNEGTSCEGSCSGTVCTAYQVLKACQETAKAACTYDFDTFNNEKDKRAECLKTLEGYADKCSNLNPNQETDCCGVNFNSTEGYDCDFSAQVEVARESYYRQCLKSSVSGSFGNCVSLVKGAAGMINSCYDPSIACPTSGATTAATASTESTQGPDNSGRIVNRNTFIEGIVSSVVSLLNVFLSQAMLFMNKLLPMIQSPMKPQLLFLPIIPMHFLQNPGQGRCWQMVTSQTQSLLATQNSQKGLELGSSLERNPWSL